MFGDWDLAFAAKASPRLIDAETCGGNDGGSSTMDVHLSSTSTRNHSNGAGKGHYYGL